MANSIAEFKNKDISPLSHTYMHTYKIYITHGDTFCFIYMHINLYTEVYMCIIHTYIK